MAPINLNIPGHVTQGPTLTMAPHQAAAASTQDVASTPWIFWVMMALVGSLVLLIIGSLIFVFAKRSALSIYNAAVYHTGIIKDACLPFITFSRFRTLTVPRVCKNTSYMSRDILPTSLDPYAPRPVILPHLRVSLALPTRAFGSSIRGKVHDIQGGLSEKYEDWKEMREYKVTVKLPALPEQVHTDSRQTRNSQESRMPHWVRRFLERKPQQKLQIPEIKIWGPGEEPPRDTQDIPPEPGMDCTIEELMAYWGVDQAFMEEISKKPWKVYDHKPLSGGKQADVTKNQNVMKKNKEDSSALNVGVGANLAPPSEVADLHSERRPGSERSPAIDNAKDGRELSTSPLSLNDDSSSESSCSPATPLITAFNTNPSVPVIRVIEPPSPKRNGTIHADLICDTAIYGLPSQHASQPSCSHAIAHEHCYPALEPITSITNVTGSPPDTPLLFPEPITIMLSPTLSPDCYLQPPERTFRTRKGRRKDTNALENKGELYKLAEVPRGRPLIFTVGQTGAVQCVGTGREVKQKTKGKNTRHGLGLASMTLRGQEAEESEKVDKRVAHAAIREDPPLGISAKVPWVSTEYVTIDGNTDSCDGRIATSALQSSTRKSGTGMEHDLLGLRPIMDEVRTSTRPRLSLSTTSPQPNADLNRSGKDRAGTPQEKAQKNGHANPLARSSSLPLRAITNSFPAHLSSKPRGTLAHSSHAIQDKPETPLTPPLPHHRFAPRTTSLNHFSQSSLSSRTALSRSTDVAAPTTKPSRTRSGTVSSRVQTSPQTLIPPHALPSVIPPSSSPPRTRIRKVVTKPPVPRYRPGGPYLISPRD